MRGEKQLVLQSLNHLWNGSVCEHTEWARLDLIEQLVLLSRWHDAI